MAKEALVKGTMALIDARSRRRALPDDGTGDRGLPADRPGNTMAGIASLGGNGAYIGKVRDDLLGEVFRHDLTPRKGCVLRRRQRRKAPGTARCLILVTADGQRTFEHLFGRLRGARARRSSTPKSSVQRKVDLSRRLFVRSAFSAAGVSQGGSGRSFGRASGRVVAVRPVLRRAPSRGVSRAGRRACRHSVRQ